MAASAVFSRLIQPPASILKLLQAPFQTPTLCRRSMGMGDTARPALVLCGPSGSGKSSLIKLLTAEFPKQFGFSVSHTTRAPRAGEEQGREYHFTERAAMEKLVEEGGFLEHAVFSGNMYGTSRAAVAVVAAEGKVCILDIDMQGVKQLKTSGLVAKYVFILPPSLEVLEQRLRERGTETEASLEKRLGAARAEMEYGRGEDNFQVVIVNDQLEKAYSQLRHCVLPLIESLGEVGGEGDQ